jgi:hypothetical protein
MPKRPQRQPLTHSRSDRTKAGIKIKGYRGKPAQHKAAAVKALVALYRH